MPFLLVEDPGDIQYSVLMPQLGDRLSCDHLEDLHVFDLLDVFLLIGDQFSSIFTGRICFQWVGLFMVVMSFVSFPFQSGTSDVRHYRWCLYHASPLLVVIPGLDFRKCFLHRGNSPVKKTSQTPSITLPSRSLRMVYLFFLTENPRKIALRDFSQP